MADTQPKGPIARGAAGLSTSGTTPGSTSGNKFLQSVSTQGGTPAGYNPYLYSPKETTVTTYGITSQPDVTALINSAMLQLVGRNATPQEIKQYGAELLAAQRANPSIYSGTLNYDPSTGKPMTSTGTDIQTGVNASEFLANLIRGTASAKEYLAGTQYMQGIVDALSKQQSLL